MINLFDFIRGLQAPRVRVEIRGFAWVDSKGRMQTRIKLFTWRARYIFYRDASMQWLRDMDTFFQQLLANSHGLVLQRGAIAVTTNGSSGSGSGGNAGTVSSFSVNFSGATTAVVSGGGYNNASVSSLTYAGVNMTQAYRFDSVATSGWHVDTWYISNPTSGANNVVWTWSVSEARMNGWIGTTGENTASPIGATGSTDIGTAGHITAGVSVTTTVANSIVVANTFINNGWNGTSLATDGTALVWSVKNLEVEGLGGSYLTTTTTGVKTQNFTWTTSTGPILVQGIEIKAAAGAVANSGFFFAASR